MKFYTNIFQRGDKIYLRGYENGESIKDIIHYKPYLFIPKKNGKYSTIDGKDLDKIEFDSIKEARDFIKQYDDVSGFEIYGLTNFLYTFIYDNYPGEIVYDPSLISVVSLDIECASDDGFPNIQQADKEITAITLRKNNHSYVFGCGDFVSNDDTISYLKCKNEYELLTNFIKLWNFKSISPEIITGWNIEFFDIPYLINRIRKLLGKEEANKLSPWNIIEERTVEFKGKENQTFNIAGVSNLDYYQLYRKFKFGNQESYKLSYIAQVEEIGDKLDYTEYGSLDSLYKNNYQKFIEYNIQDTVLIDKLDEKLGFIQQVMAFAYDAKVNYSDTMTTVRPWDVIIHNHLLDKRVSIHQFKKQSRSESLVGGYVKDVRIGLNRWVVSFDLDSLYPHLIMQYNISPDVFVERISNFSSVDKILLGLYENRTGEYSISGNGCVYRKDKQGFLAELMEKMYNDRVNYKNKMLDAKKLLQEIEIELKKRGIEK
jgi:DNA polymerase elongation subunit (family B)